MPVSPIWPAGSTVIAEGLDLLGVTAPDKM